MISLSLKHDMHKKIIVIAGPNGAGKSTFAREFLPNDAECPAFINADLIAAGLSPFQPEAAAIKAGKLMLEVMAEYVSRGNSFAFETTLAGRGYIRMIRKWRQQGYNVKLFFLSLADPEEAIARIVARVAQGGHYVPDDVVRRRFTLGLHNFKTIYRLLEQVEAERAYSALNEKLEGANHRNGYLEAQVDQQREQIKLLTDSQHKQGWWTRFCSWLSGG
jgi:predicted ABC-type ATPase